MNICIFGTTGMLGNYIYSFLSEKYNVIELNRSDGLDIKNIKEDYLIKKLVDNNIKLVINCIGITNKKDISNEYEVFEINSYFPYFLSIFCKKYNIIMIQPSTDCVFSGKKGLYKDNDITDSDTLYGKSKALSENIHACIIRTSIIGEKENVREQLVEWVLNNNNKHINGYTNHTWNGITCLEYAKIIDSMIKQDYFWTGVKHITSKYKDNFYITKYDLIKEIISIYNLNIELSKFTTENNCFRHLNPSDNCKIIYEKNIEIQLKEMKNYNIKSRKRL